VARAKGRSSKSPLASTPFVKWRNIVAFENVENICFSKEKSLVVNPMGLLPNLDDLPPPDRELSFAYPFIRRDPNVHFLAGRGCPYTCAFCFNKKLNDLQNGLGPAVRFRSVDDVIDEIESSKNKWGIKVVYFQDDTFVLRPSWLFPFLEKYRKPLIYRCFARFAPISSPRKWQRIEGARVAIASASASNRASRR